MDYMRDEKVISQICSNKLVLTTHRVRYQIELYVSLI